MSNTNLFSQFPRNVSRRYRQERGLTLVEIIVVLIILSILIGFLTSGLFKKGEQAKARLNDMKLTKAKGIIEQYQLQYNAFPPDLSALTGCNQATGSNCVPLADEEDLKDAWGTPFTYTTDGSGRSYALKSLGADRKEGGSGVDGDVTKTGP